ncbi:Saccharopine dehydrogenase, NADP-dependent [Nitrosomonas eutropha]|uniref:saccharopine dehydrogenase family protein n=1 Tax=Nitrosomonas eutropha TaxID=916 RepID=UPI0008895DD9|nr:saccharopine dehydrogenase NADP-binding domain-containing protein [Nitrosomonas eutropha]SCX18696.1 Saccharopine dehydrogenase, NADP-dependent [Nitrosomonas eutropha]SDW62686.1 Saccharopine dehydrogenase, NADP-dependent [Nitrosomonas eutropha]
MSKFLVLGGAGEEGSVFSRDLVNSGVNEIVLADYNVAQAEKLAKELNKIGNTKVSAIKADANKPDELIKIFKEQNSDVICNFVGPYYRFGPPVAEAAIKAGIPYVDINDDYEPTLEILNNLNDKAKEAKIPVFTGCGVSPGWTNMMSKLGSTKLDQTDKISIDWLWPALAGGGPGVIEHIYHMLSGKCLQYLDGEYKKVSSGTEKTRVTSTDGKFDGYVYYVGHGEPATLPRYIDGVKEVINKGGLLPSEATELYFKFIEAGLNDTDPIAIDEQMVSLTDVTVALMERKLKNSEVAKDENGYFKVTVTGKKDNKEKTLIYEIAEPGTHMTSWTASIIAQMIAKGKITETGTNAPEVLNVEQIESVLKGLEDRGLTTKRSE